MKPNINTYESESYNIICAVCLNARFIKYFFYQQFFGLFDWWNYRMYYPWILGIHLNTAGKILTGVVRHTGIILQSKH